MMAVQQYQQAASKAIEQNQYLPALKDSVRAEKALKKLYHQQFGDDAPTNTLVSNSEYRGVEPDISLWLEARGVSPDSQEGEGFTWRKFRYALYGQDSMYSLS